MRRGKKNDVEVQRVKSFTPTRAVDALIGEEEQIGKRRKRQEGKKSEKREKRKGIEAQRVKPPTPSRAADALIGDEEQN